MELVFKTVAICLVAALGASFLKRFTPELALLLSLAAAVVVLACLLAYGKSAAAILEEILERTGLEQSLFHPLLKIVGLSLVSRLGADLCKDAGQGALSGLVELGGALCGLLAAAPLLSAVVRMLGGWLPG